MSYNYTSNPGHTALAIKVARNIIATEPSESAEGAAARAVAVMRHGDKVDVSAVVRALATIAKPA